MPRRLFLRAMMAALRFLLNLPEPLLRVIAGRPIDIDGQRLATTAQVMIRISKLAPFDYPHTNGSVERARDELNAAGVLAGSGIRVRVRTTDSSCKGPGGEIPLRLYQPYGHAEPGPALVFFHGGGFVLGSIDTHDGACRYLASEAGVRVISVDYRLAPENRFPAAVEDALAAFEHVSANYADFGADPRRIAVGGDSCGGNLAAVVAHAGARGDIPCPAFSLLLNPATDAFGTHASQELFGLGFRLDTEERDWYRDSYLVDIALCRDPRASVLYDEQLEGLPPTYVATSGFDPLRDEGEAYARRLAEAGVPVVLRRHEGLLHGFASRAGVDPDARVALQHAAGVLRAGLALTTP
ncbi:alpha/beta hydrolase [Amycolatopsis sp. NPDC059657]|uniref:alpha/beta hydrolase n=1 Tax=Amycolatopsis sp. NPDC059657 TaxID=3346899 RepID=UPI00366DA6AB